MKKLLKIMGVVAVCAAFAVVVYNQVNAKPDNSLLAKNIEALTSGEGGSGVNPCPDPYDVYNYMLKFIQSRAEFTVDANGEITIAGKKIKIGGAAVGAKVSVTYLLAICDSPSPGNCCPNSRNGEVTIIGF